jgi:RHS repeat-associated protein
MGLARRDGPGGAGVLRASEVTPGIAGAERHIGRPVDATTDTGAVVWSATYYPFGGVRVTQGTPIGLRFPGQWFQAESGLHQNWMRDYDPTTGRYIQPDPLGLDGGVALYGYALQSPMVYIDPRGENPAAVGGRALCASFPALCKEIGRACVGAVIAGGTWLGIINNSESGGDELGPISPPTEGTQICDECVDDCTKEWNDAYNMCELELSKANPARGITGGYRSLYECARGLVSERCGGNRVEY